MNIAEHFEYSNTSFDELEFEQDDYLIKVSGSLNITKEDFHVPYDGNSIAGGYTETEITNIDLEIYDIAIFNEDCIRLDNLELENKIIKELKNDCY